MLVYDLTHQLAREIRQSGEYQRLRQAKEKVSQNPGARSMLEDFQKQQLALQQALLKGESISEEKKRQIEEMSRIVAANPTVTEYRVAELAMVRLMGDVEKILWDAVQDALLVKPFSADQEG